MKLANKPKRPSQTPMKSKTKTQTFKNLLRINLLIRELLQKSATLLFLSEVDKSANSKKVLNIFLSTVVAKMHQSRQGLVPI